MLNYQEKGKVFSRLAQQTDQLSSSKELPTIATYMIRGRNRIEVVGLNSNRLTFPQITDRLSFDVENLASGILAAQAVPGTKLVKSLYPHLRQQRFLGRSIEPGIISKSVFVSTKETAGLILAHCCEAMNVWSSDLSEVLRLILSEKTFYRIEDETIKAILTEAHISQVILKFNKNEFRDPDITQ